MRRSFIHALHGISSAVTQRNIKIMLCAAMLVIAAGWLLHITIAEWIAILLCCGIVIALEIINTAVETVVDLASPQMHPLAKKAKDLAAGAVLVSCFVSAAVGCIILIPHIIKLIGGSG